jgi:prepilin-type N-terminal cleavage/methylation domain-containing protein
MLMKIQLKSAFSLIELLVVLSIIGLMTTVMLPNISSAQRRAKEAALKAIVHNVQSEIEGYQVENNYYPAGSGLSLAELTETLGIKNNFKNPYTGKTYLKTDQAGQINYDFNATEGQYSLTAYSSPGQELLVLTNS